MSTPAVSQKPTMETDAIAQHKANLARIRDNQRRSRARRREYLAELEQRLRTCELQGIEASTEVQLAARRVAEENRLLRELLRKHGCADEYVAHFLQSASAASMPPELNQQRQPPTTVAGGQGQGPSVLPSQSGARLSGGHFGPSAGGNPGPAVQSLQQSLTPRRPASMDHNVHFTLPNQSRETSIASVSTNSSSLWDGTQQPLPSTYHPTMGMSQSMTNSSAAAAAAAAVNAQAQAQVQAQAHYATPVYSTDTTPRMSSLVGQQHQGGFMETTAQQHAYNPHGIQQSDHQGGHIDYGDPNAAFNSGQRDFGPGTGGGFC